MNISKILRIVWAVIWRLALTAVAAIAIAVTGVVMVLNTLFTGPSPAVRNALVTTMLEHTCTAPIPGYFLDEATIADICAHTDALPAETSDPSLIQVTGDQAQWEETVTAGHFTATVTASPSRTVLLESTGDYYANFNTDGILILSTVGDDFCKYCCENILIMNGETNTGLYSSNSGYGYRYAIGQTADGTLIHVTMEFGTIQNIIDIMTEYGAVNACTLLLSEE